MDNDELDFGPAVLKGLVALGQPAARPADLALELGMSAWMRQCRIRLEDVRPELIRARAAVLEAADMDVASEPVPFSGRTPREDALSLAVYLAQLISRAAAFSGRDAATVVDSAATNWPASTPRARVSRAS